MQTIRSMMALAALLTMGASACEGPTGAAGTAGATGPTGATGATGPAGGGYYTSRSAVYCNTNAYPAGATTTSITVSCNTTTDLPLQGSCDLSNSTSTTPYYLAISNPGWWTAADLTRPADWTCGWKDSSNAYVSPQGAAARICCITAP